MRLAHEIAEAIYRHQREVRSQYGVDLTQATAEVERLIAAMLEPVRVALQEMCDHSGLMGYLEMHHPALRCVAEEALAKLSEDECEHEWVDASNEVVSEVEMCLKCHAIRAMLPKE